MTRDDVFQLADSMFHIFMEHTDEKKFIEDDPDNKGGTRNTDQGMELYGEIEQALLKKFKIEL